MSAPSLRAIAPWRRRPVPCRVGCLALASSLTSPKKAGVRY